MVDDKSLASVPEAEGDGVDRVMHLRGNPPMKVRVVDAGHPENKAELCARAGWSYSAPPEDEEDDCDEEEDLEDEEDLDLDWMWVEVFFLCEFYNTIQADSGWDCFYVRPPGVYPR